MEVVTTYERMETSQETVSITLMAAHDMSHLELIHTRITECNLKYFRGGDFVTVREYGANGAWSEAKGFMTEAEAEKCLMTLISDLRALGYVAGAKIECVTSKNRSS